MGRYSKYRVGDYRIICDLSKTLCSWSSWSGSAIAGASIDENRSLTSR